MNLQSRYNKLLDKCWDRTIQKGIEYSQHLAEQYVDWKTRHQQLSVLLTKVQSNYPKTIDGQVERVKDLKRISVLSKIIANEYEESLNDYYKLLQK